MNKGYKATKICCYTGYFVQAVINNFLPLLFVIFNERYGLSYEKIGTLIVINFIVQICVDICSIKIIKLLGYHKCAVAANFLAAAGLVMLAVLPSVMKSVFAAIVISILFYAFGSGLIEVIISPIIEYLPTDKAKKTGEMCFLHSFYCWGQVVTVIITVIMIYAFGRQNWQYISLVWAAVPLINGFAFMKARIVDPEKETKGKKGKEKNSGIFKSVYFYIFLAFMVCAGASELAVSQWASTFAEQGMGLEKSVGDLAGPCAFALLMGTARIIYGFYGNKINIKAAMLFCISLCVICYMGIALSSSAALAMLFCALCGFSVGIMWPATISMAAEKFPSGGAAVFGLLAAAGDIGCSAGPFVAGVFADAGGLKAGFLAAAVFPAVMLVFCIFLILKDALARRKKMY